MELSETLRDCARRLAEKPGDPEVVKVLERLLDTPDRLEASRFLIAAHQRNSDHAGLVRALDVLAGATPNASERLASLERAASLLRHQLQQPAEALASLTRALEKTPADAALFALAEKLAVETKALPALKEQLTATLPRLSGAPKTALTLALAGLLAERMGDAEGAAALCREVLAHEPNNLKAQARLRQLMNPTEALLDALKAFKAAVDRAPLLAELHRLALAADALEEVAEAVEEEAETPQDPLKRAALLRFAAQVREELGQRAEATARWSAVLKALPADAEALEHLFGLLAAAGEPKLAADAALLRAREAKSPRERLRWSAEATAQLLAAGLPAGAREALELGLSGGPSEDGPEAARVQLLNGQLLEQEGDDAAVAAYQKALASPSTEAEAVAGLERLLAQLETRLAAARALEAPLRKVGDPRRLAAALEAILEAAASKEEQVARLSELARLWETVGETRVALGAQMRLFALAAADEQVRADLERLTTQLNAKDELVAAYEEQLEREPGTLRAHFARRIAELHEALGERDRAFDAWGIAAEADRQNLELLKAYGEKARQRGDLKRLAQAMRWQAAAMPDSKERTELLQRLARICEDALGDLAAAAAAYEELLQAQPQDKALLRTLTRLYESTRDDAGLRRVLAKDLALARAQGAPEAVALALRLAKLRLTAPRDERGALELLAQVLQADPTNAHAVAALAQLASSAGPVQAEATKLATTALDRLGDYPVVVQILETQLATTTSPRDRAAILSQLSELHLGPLKDPELAFLSITRALREAPDDPAILERCAAMAQAAGSLQDLEDLLAELAQAQPKGAGRLALLRALAQRQEARGATGEAIGTWLRALDDDPKDEAVHLHLVPLLEKTQRFDDLVRLAQRGLEAATPEERPKALAALAAAKERAGQLADAASTLLSLFALTQSKDTLIALERVLERQGRHSERAEALRRLAEAATDPKERTNRLLQQARALVAAQEPELAVSVFAQILRQNPEEPRAVADLVALTVEPKVRQSAVELLGPVFKGEGQGWQRVAVLEVLVDCAGPEHARVLRAELAGLFESLGDLKQAFAARRRLVLERPEDPRARAELERLAQSAQLEEELLGAYEDVLDRPLEPKVQLQVRTAVARLYSGRLDRPTLATPAWEEVSRLDPQALEPLEALAQLYRRAGEWKKLSEVLKRQAALLPDAEAQLLRLRELASLASEHLGQPAEAAEAWRAIAERAPQDVGAHAALADALTQLGRHAEAADALERQLALTPHPDARAGLELRLGQLLGGPLARPAQALAHYVRTLELHPRDTQALLGLESLLDGDPQVAAQAAAVLEPEARVHADAQKLAELLELQLFAAEPQVWRAKMEELATLRESLGELPQAFAVRRELFLSGPRDEHARSELERLADATRRHDELAQAYRARLGTALPDDEALELWRRLARLHGRFGQTQGAVQAWEEVARRTPDDATPLAALCELHLAAGAYPRLPALFRRRAELEPEPAKQVALLLELAELSEHKLRDPNAAVEACRLALARAPGDARAIAALERLLQVHGRFAELGELLLAQVKAAAEARDEATELSLRARLAKLQHGVLKNDGAALGVLVGILNRQPGHPEAVAVLEEVMRAGRPSADQAAALLEAHYAQAGASGPLVEALEVRAEWASTSEGRAAFLHRIADLHEADGEPGAAFDCLDRLLRELPDDARALERVLALGASGKSQPALAALLTELAPRAASPQTRAAMYAPLARLRESFGEVPQAIEAWRGLLAVHPDDAEALEASARLLETAGRWAELAQVLEHRFTLTESLEQRAALLAQLGALREDRLDDAAGAYDTFARLLELRPDDGAALQRLDHLGERLERWQELGLVLQRRMQVEPEHRTDFLLRLAQLKRVRLGSGAGALPLLLEVLEGAPDHPRALEELERLVDDQPGWEPAQDVLLAAFRRRKEYGKLVRLLDSCAGLALTPQKRRDLWLELCTLRLEQERDAELAFLACSRAWREDPADAALRTRLVELAQKADANEALATLFEEVLPHLDAGPAAEVGMVLGGLYEGPLQEPQRAVKLYRKALERSPEVAPRAWASLQRVLESLGRWAELIPVLEAREKSAPDSVARVGLLLKLATVAADKLQMPVRATEAYRAVLELDPKHLGAARELESLYERAGDHERLVGILEHLLLHVPAEQRNEVRLKLARLCVTSAPERTIALCRQLLAEDPLHAEAFNLLADRLEAAARYPELDQVLRARLQLTLAPAEAAPLGYRLGELTWRRLGNPKGAVAHFEAVIARAPRHLGALEALEELHETLGQKAPLAEVLARLVAVRTEPELKRGHLVRRAEVLAELGQREGAVASAREALDASPDPSEAQRLRALLLTLQALPEAARALALCAVNHLKAGRTAEAVATFFELAKVELERGNTAGATAAFEAVLTHEPARREAYQQARDLYAGGNQWSNWANLVARFLPNLSGAEKLAALDELAERHEVALIDAPGAFEWAQEAVRLDPASSERRARVERLAQTLRRAPVLAKLYRELLQSLRFGPAFTALSLTLAQVEDEQLDQPEAAAKTLARLLEHDPGNADALDLLAAMHARRANHAKLAQALELKLEATPAAEGREALLLELAQLQEEQLNDPKAAARALQRLFELRPDAAHAGLLVELHQRHEQWPEALHMLLETRKLMTTPAERARVQLLICDVYESKLDDLEAAVAGYQQALEYEPGSSAAFRALERLYLKLARPAELLRAYDHRLAQATADEEKVELLYKSADLWEQRKSLLQADRCLEQVVQLRPKEVRALEGLARLRRAGERWRPLTEVLAKLVELAPSPERRAELCTELGTASLELRDGAQAARWLTKALDQVPTHRPALKALCQLHQRENRWAEAAKLLDREAQLEADPKQRAALEHQAGTIREERLRELTAARESYQRALKADPVHLPALRKLRALFFRAGEWPQYEQNLEHEATRAPLPADRYAAAFELAQHFQKRAHDAPGAIRWYEQALVERPDALDASLPLADLLLQAKTWGRAVGVLQGAVTLLEKQKPVPRAELITRLCQLGEATRQAGKPKQALDEWARALALDAAQPDALRGQFEVLDAAGRSEEAVEKLVSLLEHHPRVNDRAALNARLGELYWGLGKAPEAQAAGERALSVDASNVPALRVLVNACEAQSLFEKSVLYRQRLAGLVGAEERPGQLFDLGVVAQDKLKKPARAIEAFAASLALKPGEKRVLERLVVAYRDAGHNRKAAETLQSLLEVPDLPVAERRRHTLALAELVARSPNELDRAALILERGLDKDPAFTEAFEALVKLHTDAKAWRKLDQSLEKMVYRLGDAQQTAPARAELWQRLADLRLSQLKDRGAGLEALKSAALLLPDDSPIQETFADLAMELPDRVDDALLAYQRALPTMASPLKYCTAAAKVAQKRGDLDSAYLAASAAALLAPPAAAEQAQLDKWRAVAQVPPRFRAPVSEQGWKESLLHPEVRGAVGQLMAFLYEHAGPKYAGELGDFKLHPKKHAIDVAGASHPSLRYLVLVARSLGFEGLSVLSPYFAPQSSTRRAAHPDDTASLRVYPTHPMTLVVGEKFFAEKDPAALSALIGSRLAYLRPELALSRALPPAELSVLFEAALCVADESRVSSADPKALKAEVKRLSKALSSSARGQLTVLVRRSQDQLRAEHFTRYLEGIRQTPIRAALLVAGDFHAVRTRIFPEGEPAQRALRQMLRFALGGELHALRMATGTQLTAR